MRARLGVIAALAAGLLTGAVAIADVIDADVVEATSGNQTTRDLGTVAPGATLTPPVSFQLRCNGSKHVDQGQTVTMTPQGATLNGQTVSTSVVSATPASIGGVPAAWPRDGAPCGTASPLDDTGNSTVTIKAPTTPGDYTAVVTYKQPTLNPPQSDDSADITGTTPAVTFTFKVSNPDADQDGKPDSTDNCPTVKNADQADQDGDHIGDACDDDIDGDGVANAQDAFPRDAAESKDSDGDRVGDNADNCPTDSNADQADADRDGKGDACDLNSSAPAVATAAGNVSGNEGDELRTSGAFKDADGAGTLTITKKSGAGTVIDNGNGTWTWKQTTTDDGSGTVEVQADDGEHAVAVDSFAWSAVNVAPTAPGKPGLTNGSNPNRSGQFTLGWTRSTDVAGDTVTYTLKSKDADDAGYSVVASGIATSSYTFGSGNAESEGTRSYKVQASDDDGGDSADSDASDAVKVDKSKPNAPDLRAPVADYSGTSGNWYKDSVSVTVTDNGDPALADGSQGSGVDASSFSSPLSVTSNGVSALSQTVNDNVGNESAAGTLTVRVDRNAPTVTLDCSKLPATIYKGASVSLPWSATDGESGVKGASSGSVTLDTSSVGTKSATMAAGTVQDNVGHASAASNGCAYRVIYQFTGFFQPIDNGGVLNAAKAGSTVPVKFSLSGDQGLGILNGTPAVKAITCDSSAPVDTLEETSTATTSGLKYDALAGQYIYNWKTASSYAGSCQQLIVRLVDGTQQTALFRFVK